MKDSKSYVTKVRNNYVVREQNKLDELRALDRKARRIPAVTAGILGVVAALLLGTGMCLAMKVIGAALMSSAVSMTVGIIVGCVGIALGIADYFIFKKLSKVSKNKYAEQILSISNELLNEQE